jgi:hypothetical protein
VSNEQTQSETHEEETEYSVCMEVGISFLEDCNTLTWTSKTERKSTSKQEATALLAGPAYGYEGPTTVLVYWDTLYSSFAIRYRSRWAALKTGDSRPRPAIGRGARGLAGPNCRRSRASLFPERSELPYLC